jgi:hypothetical protein
MNGESLGSVEFGETFDFVVSNRDADGAAISGFTPAYFDVIDPDDGSAVLSDQALTQTNSVWRGSVDTSSLSPRKTYGVKVKAAATANPTTFILLGFTVTGAFSNRLSRILGLEGVNRFIDCIVTDSGGNMTSCRIRLFDTAAHAAAAVEGSTDEQPGEFCRVSLAQEYTTGLRRRTSQLTTLESTVGEE